MRRGGYESGGKRVEELKPPPSAAERGDAAASPQPADDVLQRAAALLWDALSDGHHPHDGREAPFGLCPQCGNPRDAGECSVDWRKPLHIRRYIAAAKVLADAGLLVTADELATRQFMADHDLAISDAEADRIIYIARRDKAVLDAADAVVVGSMTTGLSIASGYSADGIARRAALIAAVRARRETQR